jgi:hypothetical protein
MRSFWVVDEDRDYPGIMADTYEQAEDIFWRGVMTFDYPFDAIIIEMEMGADDFHVYEPVQDCDIISIEEAS